MKYKKWLPIVVAILFLINLAAFIVFRVIDVDLVVKKKITDRIERALEAEVSIEDFTLDDQQINISGMTINWRKENMKLTVDQVYIRYRMRRLLFSGFRIPGVIEQVSIYNPRFDIRLVSGSDKSSKPMPSIEEILDSIPDLSGYFKVLTAENGMVTSRYESPEFTIVDTIKAIRIHARNDELCQVDFATGDSISWLTGNVVMQRGEFLNADISLNNYRPDYLDIPLLDRNDFRLDSHVRLTRHGLALNGAIRDLAINYENQRIRADSIAFGGSVDTIRVRTDGLWFNGDPVHPRIEIARPLSENPTIEGTFYSVIDSRHYVDDIEGRFEIDGTVSNRTGEMQVRAGITCDSLRFKDYRARKILGNLDLDLDRVQFAFNRIILRDNQLSADGVYDFREGLQVDIHAPGFYWDESGNVFEGDLEAAIQYRDDEPLRAQSSLQGLRFHNQYVDLADLSAEIRLDGDMVTAEIVEDNEHLDISLEVDLERQQVLADLHFRRFDLNRNLLLAKSGGNLPSVNGKIHVTADRNNIQLDSRLRIYEERYGMLDGFLITDAAVDLLHGRTYLHMRTRSGVYNYEPVKFHLLAAGTLDSLRTLDCRLNDRIAIDLRVTRKPEFDFGFHVQAKDIDIPQYLKYSLNYYMTRKFDGETDFDVSYNMDGDRDIRGWLTLEDFRYENMRPLSSMLRFEGNADSVRVEPFLVSTVGHPVTRGDAMLRLGEKPSASLNLQVDELDLRNLFEDADNEGIVSGLVRCRFMEDDDHIEAKMTARDISLRGYQADLIQVEAIQDSRQLRIDTLYARQYPYYEMSASGAIGYNFLREKAYEDSSTVRMQFSGDFLKMLSDRFDFLQHGKSTAGIELQLGLKDEQLNICSGSVVLKDGEIKPDYFNAKIRDIQIDMRIEDDVLDIREFSLGTEGPGRLHIENGDIGAEDQFALGGLEMGYIYVFTDREGIWASIPWYMPENTLANAVVKGRYEDRLKVTGPFDDIHVLGDVMVSNGSAIYPEDVTSLLDIVGTETTSWLNDRLRLRNRQIKEKEKGSRYSEYVRIGVPITMDLMLHFTDNCFYAMNPCNFLVNPDSYLQLFLWDKYIFVKEAMFTSERGTMDLFGSTFQVDYVEVVVNQYLDKKGDEILGLGAYDVKIKASLYNKTADGTLIMLDVIPQDQDRKNIIGNLQFQLRSDDPNDQTVMSMLSKLKYGRSHDEVTQQQQEALFQDEALYMAGAGVENIYINPFLSPVENTVRKFLRLDYFYIRPGIFRNLFYEYAGSHVDEVEPVEQESNMSRFSGILLNDLSIRFGKYLSRNLFVDYEFLVEKTTDIERTRMTLSHDFTVRYDLPWRFRLGYTYRLENDIDHQVHQIMLEKSLRF